MKHYEQIKILQCSQTLESKARAAWSLLLLMVAPVIFSSCKSDDEQVFQGSGNTERKPATILVNELQDSDALGQSVKEAASITYIIRVKGNSGIELCNGLATLKVMTDFNISLPQADIQCQSIVIDLGGLLGGEQGLMGGDDSSTAINAQDQNSPPSNLSHDGRIFYLRELMGGEFDPPRPMLIGPIIQKPEKYRKLDQTTTHTVTGIDPATNQRVSGRGQFRVKVLEQGGFYDNKYLNDPFESVMHWQLEASGFENFPPNVGLTVEKMEWWWNTRPIMIPQIIITGHLKNFMYDPNGSTDAVVGRIELSLIVKDYKIAE